MMLRMLEIAVNKLKIESCFISNQCAVELHALAKAEIGKIIISGT